MTKLVFWIPIIGIVLSGCGKGLSERDACYDSKAPLWNPKIEDNRYEGNERYWDAVKQCDNQYP